MYMRICSEPTAGLIHDGTRSFIVQPMEVYFVNFLPKDMRLSLKKMTTRARVLTSNLQDRTNQFYIDMYNKTDFNIFIDERT